MPRGQFKFKFMTFGLCNAPSTFERLIVAFGWTFSDSRECLGWVLGRLGEAGLKIKPSKCLFKGEVTAVLSQVDAGGKERVLRYASRALNRVEWNYCVTRRKLLGMIFGVRKFRAYLARARFTIRTDHSALRWLL